MENKKTKNLEPKKAWKAPTLIIHGDVTKITKEAPIPGPGFGSRIDNPSLT